MIACSNPDQNYLNYYIIIINQPEFFFFLMECLFTVLAPISGLKSIPSNSSIK